MAPAVAPAISECTLEGFWEAIQVRKSQMYLAGDQIRLVEITPRAPQTVRNGKRYLTQDALARLG
jgi:hypothetical protein